MGKLRCRANRNIFKMKKEWKKIYKSLIEDRLKKS